VALPRLSQGETESVKDEFEERYGAARARRVIRPWLWDATVFACGVGLSVLGAHGLVTGAVGMAWTLGLSEVMIGVTIVAFGTPSPEHVTTIVATLQEERDVAVGNLLGSSIYNKLVILGLTCLASPNGVPVERQMLFIDIPLMAVVARACVLVFVTGSAYPGGKAACSSRFA
jgi:cation:H+ antiporter